MTDPDVVLDPESGWNTAVDTAVMSLEEALEILERASEAQQTRELMIGITKTEEALLWLTARPLDSTE